MAWGRLGRWLGICAALCCAPSLVAAATGPVRVIGFSLADNGDDDGFADTNETVSLRIRVRNVGHEALTGVVARLTSADASRACVTGPTAVVGDLAAGEVRTADGTFTFKVGELVERVDPFENLVATLAVRFTSDQHPVPADPQPLALDLDLDAVGGAGPTTFFESFEVPSGYGSFEAMNLDFGLSSLSASDGYRCQYSDPWFTNSNSYGIITDCYLGATAAQADAFHWRLDAPGGIEPSRAYSGQRSLHMGIPLGSGDGFTTPLAILEAVRSVPIGIGVGRVCAESREIACDDDLDCPALETCVPTAPSLSIKHQVSLIDERTVNASPGEAADRAVVQLQLADDAGLPVGVWQNLDPYVNPGDATGTDDYINCMFDAVDDGSDEDDFFDPTDPDRRLGPSSTCYPGRVFAYLGDTDAPFNPVLPEVGNAADGPGLEGDTGIGTWVESSFDLSRYRGRRVRLRFLFTSIRVSTAPDWEWIFNFNPDPGDDGWWIDDVAVTDALSVPASLVPDTQDNSGLPGGLSDGDADGFFDVCDNCPTVVNGEQTDQDGDLVGDACDPCPLEFVDDEDGDGLCCPADNCCRVANLDQLDADGDGVGDDCDTDPVFRVSADPADEPDYATVGEAVEAATESGTRIQVLPGLYEESVVVDSGLTIHFEGVDDGSGEPVVIDGGSAPALSIRSSLGDRRVYVRNLTLTGAWGISARVPVTIEDCAFDHITVTAVELHASGNLLRRLTVAGPGVNRGVRTHPGTYTEVRESRFLDVTSRAVWAGGAVALENCLIDGGVYGVFAEDAAEISHCTVTGCDIGILANGWEIPVAIRSSIVHGNADDVSGVDCAGVSWSNLGTDDCTAVNDNLRLDPSFNDDFTLSPESRLLDHGPPPSTYTGVPCHDLGGLPRLRDFDRDGLAQVDPGAFELPPLPSAPGAVTVVWTDAQTLIWAPASSAQSYHVYRDELPALGFDHFGTCRDDLDANRTDTVLVDPFEPPSGQGVFYVVTAETAGGIEGSLGVGTCAERSDFDPCP